MPAGELNVVVGGGNPLNRPDARQPLEKFEGAYSYEDTFAKSLVEAVPVTAIAPTLRRRAYRTANKAKPNDPNTKSAEGQAATGYNLLDVARPPYNLDYLAKISEVSSANYAAIRAKVSNIIGLGYELVITERTRIKMDGLEGDRKARAAKRVALARLDVKDWLEGCCKGSDFIDVLTDVWTDYEATGNGYIEIGRKANGDIGYIGHLPATTMRVRRARDGFVQIVGDKVVFFRQFGDQKTKDPIGEDPRPNEIIHIKKYSSTNGYYGVPDVVAALPAVAGNHFAELYNLEYFENKAVPRYIIKTKGPQLSPAHQAKLAEFFAANVKGQNHRTVYVPLPPDEKDVKNDFEIVPVEVGVQDSSFTNYHKINLQTVLMVHRVPLTKVTMPESTTLGAAKDFDKTFKEQTCQPEQDRLEKRVNKILKEYTDMFEINLNELSLTDEAEQAKIDEVYIKNDVFLANEVRERKGLSDIADGDKSFSEKQRDAAEASRKDPTAQQRAETAAQQRGSRERDARRRVGGTDSRGLARNPAGEGRSVD